VGAAPSRAATASSRHRAGAAGLRPELHELFASDDAGEAQFRRVPARYTGRPVKDDDLRRRIDELAGRLGVFSVKEARNLFICFEEEKVKLAKKKLAGLTKEYERWVLAKASAENDRDRGLERVRCQELEQELTVWKSRWKSRLTPLDDQLADLRSSRPTTSAGWTGRFGV
jgi:hypothetical protein